MDVSLSEELEAFVQQRVAAGLNATPSEVVREALRLLSKHEQSRDDRLSDLKRAIAQGLESAEAGRLVEGEAAMSRILDSLRSGALAAK